MNLGFIFRFSFKNLGRNKIRSLILILSIAFATAYMIFDLNFADSGSKEIIKDLLKQYFGKQQITHKDYYAREDSKSFNVYKTLSLEDVPLEKYPALVPRITLPVLISGSNKTLGVLMVGIDPEKERKLTKLSNSIKEGNYFREQDQKSLIIGKKLALKIGAKIGDEIGIVGQGLDGSLANDLFRLVGLIDFGGGDLEEALCFTSLASAREFASVPSGRVHQLVDFDLAHDTILKFDNLKTSPWQKILPEIAVSVRFIDHFTWIVSIIIVLVISLGLANSLMITFLEREKEFQSLNIIGASPRWIQLTLISEIFFMTTLGIVLGTVGGHFLTIYFYHHPINIEFFTGGKPIMMGGMTIVPLVRLYPVEKYYWLSPLVIYLFVFLSMIYPLFKVSQRSIKDAG